MLSMLSLQPPAHQLFFNVTFSLNYLIPVTNALCTFKKCFAYSLILYYYILYMCKIITICLLLWYNFIFHDSLEFSPMFLWTKHSSFSHIAEYLVYMYYILYTRSSKDTLVAAIFSCGK